MLVTYIYVSFAMFYFLMVCGFFILVLKSEMVSNICLIGYLLQTGWVLFNWHFLNELSVKTLTTQASFLEFFLCWLLFHVPAFLLITTFNYFRFYFIYPLTRIIQSRIKKLLLDLWQIEPDVSPRQIRND